MTADQLAVDVGSLIATQIKVHYRDGVLAEVPELRIDPGQSLTIVGESGSGKSILAHALMGTLPAELSATGSLRLGSMTFDVADQSNRRHLWGTEFALLPQEPALALDPTMRVLQQVAEGVRGWRPRDRRALSTAHDKLARLELADSARQYPHVLSGGMAQRVAYAAATVGGARFLIVDEPSKGLDPAALDTLADLLTEHLAAGGLLLTITHDLRLASRLGGTVMVMRDASVVERGPADQVLTAPQHDYTKQLIAADPEHWRKPWQTALPAHQGALIVAERITKSYGDRRLFGDLSLQVDHGERIAITGPSGVGKTTLGNALLGLTRIDSGRLTRAKATEGGKIQKLYQDPTLSFPDQVSIGSGLGDVMRRYGVERGRVESLLSKVGLDIDLLNRRPGQVSGGELQRIAIIRAMIVDPVLLFADEATSRLDLVTQEQTMDLLMTELTKHNCALLLVTHDEALASAVTHRRIGLAGPTEGQR